MKISAWWLLAVLIIGIAATYLYFKYIHVPSQTVIINPRSRMDVVTLTLPRSSDPAIFGPRYWQAFHSLADRIPCVDCRSKAVPFMRFFHDVVNYKTKKPFYDKENYNKHLDFFSTLPKA